MNLLKKRILNAPVYVWLAVLAADCLLVTVYMFFYQIRDIVIKYNPVCLLYSMGFRCGLCGGTRCLTALMHGDFVLAIKNNFFIVVLLAGCLVLLILAHICLLRNSRRISTLLKRVCSVKGLTVVMIYWLAFMIIRNVIIVAQLLMG